jgi:hypothetical protein
MNGEQIRNLILQGVRVTFEQRLRDVLAPAFMRGTWSQRWLGTLGAFVEMIWQGGQEAADVGFPARCPDDALDHVGSMLNIERLVDEGDGTYRDRLRTPFTTWQASGTAAGIASQLEGYGLQNVEAYDIAAGWHPGDEGSGPADINTYSYNRFWVTAEAPAQWTPLEIGDDFVLGDDVVIGVAGMTQTDYRNVRRLLHKWRPAHATPVDLYLIFSGTLADTTTADADAMEAAGDAAKLPITAPWLGDHITIGDDFVLGYYIEPI